MITFFTACLVWSLVGPLCLAGAVLAGESQDTAQCPLSTPGAYSAAVVQTSVPVMAGDPARICVQLDPAAPPLGFFVSVLIEPMGVPDGAQPTILAGFPDSKVKARIPGLYTFEVRINLISKSSCGGVKVRQIGRDIVQLRVESKGL